MGRGERYAKRAKKEKEISSDPWLQEQTFDSFVKLSFDYPEAKEGYIKCGVCGDDITATDIFGWKFDVDRDHPLYYICERCASQGRIGSVYVQTADGEWMQINVVE